MTRQELLSAIEKVKKIATASRLERMLANPVKYFRAIFFREIIYRRTRKSWEVQATTFFGFPMRILLPSATDIYLTGGKSHSSEIRLARYLIRNLRPNDSFLDVGAHYGYFSLLAAQLVGGKGRVTALEASPSTFRVLNKNTSRTENITAINKAVSDQKTELSFFEFPNLYSEYNTIDVSQFKDKPWLERYQPSEIRIQADTLDNLLAEQKAVPSIIKIDVEGAEFQVVSGAKNFLENHSPAVIMEYLPEQRGNTAHVKAEAFLNSLHYTPHIIDDEGVLQPVSNVSIYLHECGMESDNIAFVKTS
jgi:FkbM family methyltransferase